VELSAAEYLELESIGTGSSTEDAFKFLAAEHADGLPTGSSASESESSDLLSSCGGSTSPDGLSVSLRRLSFPSTSGTAPRPLFRSRELDRRGGLCASAKMASDMQELCFDRVETQLDLQLLFVAFDL
jgi:hypothetical protein